jgi:hypothetical protein
VLGPEIDPKSDRSGIIWRGETNVVDFEPEPQPELDWRLSKLIIDPIVGERVIVGFGMLMNNKINDQQPFAQIIK